MYKEAIRPVWAEINLSNLDYNIKNIKAKLGSGTKIIGVVKADGYGHGSVKVAEVLRANGVDTFAVSTLQEAIVLREAGATEQIISLSLTPNFYSNVLVEYDIAPVISSLENARAISKTAAEVGKAVSGFIAADTGMGRIGYLTWAENAVSEIKEISQLPNFKIAGLFSHMSTADSADKTFSRQQEQCFNEFYDKLIAAGIEIPMRTFANSASVMELPSVYFDAVRPGIILYGCYPSDEVDKSSLSLKPVMSVKATISHLKDVPAGFSVSYGREFISKRPSKIATIALGYADGYPRPYAPKGVVIVNGVKAPLAGNICMDQCMIDVTDVPDVKVGDEVIVMGSDGKNTILADDIAKATGTINYEIICAFGQRLPKVYVR